MANNIPGNTKKLALKSELIKHLETATRLHAEGKGSSEVKVISLNIDMYFLEHFGLEPDIKFWEEFLGEG
jgi:hypothetical protein